MAAQLKASFASLQASEELYRGLFDGVPSGLYRSTPTGQILDVNPAFVQMLGYPDRQTLLAVNATDTYIDPENRRQWQSMVEQEGVVRDFETQVRRHDGTTIWVHNSCRTVRDENGQVQYYEGSIRDITDQKRAEVQRLELALAQERAKVLTEFLNTISHDLKTPLTIINTAVYMLERVTDPQAQGARLQVIKNQTVRLEKLVEDILTMSRLDTVRELERQSLDVNRLARDIQSYFGAVAENKNLTINLNLQGSLPPILADEDSLNRALTNLVENELNYTPVGGTILIQSSVQGSDAVLEITDSGIGIGPADLPHIFDPFYRADKARSAHTGGTGLGLAIVKKIVEMHRGSIEVESTLGVGTTFRVRLPTLPGGKVA
jgi:PAS domain S-box-containing protein